MTKLRLTRELLADGYSYDELARRTRSGEIQHVRRGVYDCAEATVLDAAFEHVRLARATVRIAAPTAVVSHLSAAVLHGLPVLTTSLARVQLTRADISGGKNRGGIHLYATPLASDEVAVVDGIRVTSLARTIVDVARTLPFEQAVLTGDAAVRRGLATAALEACLERSVRRPGMASARRVVRFLDPLSESPGESLSRAAIRAAMLPPPTLQYEVRDRTGRVIGRSDFCWLEQRTLGEFDGRIKYGRLLKPGETPSDVMYREKLREDAFRDLGWQVVRWTWADLKTPQVIADRIVRAFARAAPERR